LNPSPNWSSGLKFYDFLDKAPAIGKLVIIEGTERVLADRALEVILDRLLPPEVRDLNLNRFAAESLTDAAGVNNRFSFKVCAISFPEQASSAHDLELAVADLLPHDSANSMLTIEALTTK